MALETNPPAKDSTQQRAGQYYLLEKIAQGGMAEIYKGLAYDLAGIKKTVCIKKILPHIAASQEFIDMLVDEAKIAVQLNHGSIAQVYDLGKAGDDYFIVMEYVDGQSLSRIFKRATRLGIRIPIPIVCYLVAEIASGLSYMHQKTDEERRPLNIIHRDISPQNIVVSYAGTLKIIDFGIAKAAVQIGHTESGVLKGKFAYMSPEHVRGDKLDHRNDIFSLGVILHELLTGVRLFKGANNKETLKNVRKAHASPPSKIVKEIPQALDVITLKALAKDRRNRYPFASELQTELLQFLYSHYPDFQPAEGAKFVQELFQEERSLKRRLSEDEKPTPHLILEPTKKVEPEPEEKTAGGAPNLDWREFMLEDDWPEEAASKSEDEEELEEPSPLDAEDLVDRTERTKQNWRNWLPEKPFGLWSFFLLLGITIGGFFLWRYWPKATQVKIPSRLAEAPAKRAVPPFAKGGEVNPSPAPAPAVKIPPPLVVIESDPAGAQIFLDDEATGLTTPAELKNLPTDQKQRLGLFLPRYKFYKTEFAITAGETRHFFVALQLDYASLMVLSNPKGATVLFNGTPMGATPLQRETMEPGTELHITVTKEGYTDYQTDLKLEPGKEHTINAVLEKLAPPE